MSQAKISRIETGRVLPTVVDVERVLHALDVPAEQAQELLKLVRATNVDFVFLQTEEYIRSNVDNPLSATSPAQREALVAAKLTRRDLLSGRGTRFRLVLTEDAVRFPMADARTMVMQVRHLRTVLDLPSVRLGVIPATTVLQKSPLNTFVVYDRRLVTMETFAGSVAFRDPSHVDDHLRIFGYFEANAVYGDELRSLLEVIENELPENAVKAPYQR